MLTSMSAAGCFRGSPRTEFVMWFVGKPVLDHGGHLGKGPEKSAATEPLISVC